MSIQTPDTSLLASASPREKISHEAAKPRRHVYMFKPQFAGLVEFDLKLQTCRPPRERMPEIGDIADLRTWTGLPYRSKQRKLVERSITAVVPVKIMSGRKLIYLNEVPLCCISRDIFARADGFECAQDFFGFFREAYEEETWHGFVTFWHPFLLGDNYSLEQLKRYYPAAFSRGGAETRGGK